MTTLEQVQRKVRANFPSSAVASAKPLEWNRETAHSMVTTDNRYRLSRTKELRYIDCLGTGIGTVNVAKGMAEKHAKENAPKVR